MRSNVSEEKALVVIGDTVFVHLKNYFAKNSFETGHICEVIAVDCKQNSKNEIVLKIANVIF